MSPTSRRLRWLVIILAIILVLAGWLSAWWFQQFRVARHTAEAAASSEFDKAMRRPTVKPLPRMTFSPSEPVRLRIPKLQLDAPVVPVGRTSTGEMAAPEGRHDVGWYSYGYLPGVLGNATLAAHSWHEEGEGAFSRLQDLVKGDTIEVETKTKQLRFIVAHARSYPQTAQGLTEVFGPSDTARLNLVTCIGTWDEAAKRYEERLVVMTEYDQEI